jgi:hypothetical protein
LLRRARAVRYCATGDSKALPTPAAELADVAPLDTFVIVVLVLVQGLAPLLLLLLAVVAVRPPARSSPSMSSKSPSVSTVATCAPRCLPFLLSFGILRDFLINNLNADVCDYDVIS